MLSNRLPISVFALGLLAVPGLRAQSVHGGLRGAVSDPQGATVAGAKVTLLDEATGTARSTLSSSDGEYALTQVVPSTYTVVAENPGFKKFERKGIVVATQQFVTLDLKLEVGQVTESVLVSAEAPMLETSNASQGQVVDHQQLSDLPNLGRNPFMMSKLAQNVVQVGNPGYNRMQDQSGSSQIAIAGGPVRGNNYLLDGIPITDASNRAIIIPSLEAVEEVKVQANTYDAEMARTGGGMFNTYLRSGGNSYHGSLLGYMRETSWLANTFFNNKAGLPITNQPFRNYGGSFGGPITIPKVYNGKNRTFFWLTFEGYRDTQAASSEFATPSMLERTGDFSQSFTRAGTPHLIYDPRTTRSDGAGGYLRDPFPGNIIPADRIDPVGRNIAATYVAPTSSAAYFGANNLSAAANLPSKADQWDGKVDQQITSWWRASLSYLRYYSLEPGETWFPTVSSPAQWRLERKVDSTQVNTLLTPNATTVVSVRYGFNRFPNYGFQASQGFNPATLGFPNSFVKDIPSLTFPNVTMETMYSLGTNNNFYYVHHSNNLSGQLSKYKGRHSMKFGADYRRIHADGLDYQNSSGAFTFNDVFTRATPTKTTAGTGSDLASMLLGYPNSGSGYIPTNLYDYADYYGIYAQDDFRVSSKLTLNLGVRWELEKGIQENNNGLITGFDRTATNPLSAISGVPVVGVVQFAGVDGAKTSVGNPNMSKFGPRVGLAYQFDEKTTIRAGYGLFWAPQFALGSPYNPEGYTASTPYVGSFDGGATPAGTLSNPFPAGLIQPAGNSRGGLTGVGNSISIFDPNSRSPRVNQFSLDVQRQLPANIVLSAGYVGSRTSHLVLGTATRNMNQLYPQLLSMGSSLLDKVANPFYGKGGAGVIGSATVSRAQLLLPFPQFGTLGVLFSDANSASYDSMILKAQKRFSQGLTFLAAYTWSRNMDMSSGGAGNNLNSGNVGPQDAYNMPAEWSLSNVHSPHRLSLASTYELPFGKGKAYLASSKAWDYIAGGWSINAIAVMQTGYPIQISQLNNNSVIGAASQRPNATGLSPATEGSLGDKINRQNSTGSVGYLDPLAFSQAPQFTFGNTSRTLGLRGPGQVNWDLSVFKTVTVYERFKAQFRAEALNAMNTPLFRAPTAIYGNSQFGRITSQANFPRMIQLGLRLYF
jgi:trimeric autotransporter adhesin